MFNYNEPTQSTATQAPSNRQNYRPGSKNYELLKLLLKTSAKSKELPLIVVDAEIENLIEHLGLLLDCGRIAIYRLNPDSLNYYCTHEWRNQSYKQYDFDQTINAEGWPVHKQNKLGHNYSITNSKGIGFTFCKSLNITSWLSIPFLNLHNSLGCIALEHYKSTAKMPNDIVQTLSLFAAILENIEIRIEQDHRLRTKGKKLLATETRYQTILENFGDLVFVLDSSFCISYLTPNTIEAFNLDKNQIFNKPISEVLDIKLAEQILAQCHRMQALNLTTVSETYEIYMGSELKFFELKFTLKSTNNSPPEFIGVARDITHLKYTQENLKKSRKQEQIFSKQYNALFSNNSVSVISIDFNGEIKEMNDHQITRLGFENIQEGRYHLIGKPLANYVAPNYKEELYSKIKLCQIDHLNHHSLILKEKTVTGKIIGGKWEFKYHKFDSDSTPVILCIGFDITEQLKGLEHLETLLKRTNAQNIRLSNLAYVLTHNLRADAVNIIGLAQLITMQVEDETLKAYTNKLDQGNKKLNATIQKLYTIATITSQKHSERVDLNKVIKDAFDSQNQDFKQEIDQIQNTIPPNAILINGSHRFLLDTFCNLFSNAFNNRNPIQKLKIKTHLNIDDEYAQIIIENNGLSIDFDLIPKETLFDLYNPKHNHPDAKALHMYLNKNQIEALDGKLDVVNLENGGVKFSIEFKLERFQNI